MHSDYPERLPSPFPYPVLVLSSLLGKHVGGEGTREEARAIQGVGGPPGQGLHAQGDKYISPTPTPKADLNKQKILPRKWAF